TNRIPWPRGSKAQCSPRTEAESSSSLNASIHSLPIMLITLRDTDGWMDGWTIKPTGGRWTGNGNRRERGRERERERIQTDNQINCMYDSGKATQRVIVCFLLARSNLISP